MRRSILSRFNTCYPNNGSGSKTGPFLPPGQFRLGPSKIVSAPAIQVPKEKSTGPIGPAHEALESLRFQRRIIRDYEFLHDVRRYLRVVRRIIGLHASTKGLVPPEEGMRKIAVFTRLLPRTELLHPRVRVKYVAMCHRGPAPGRQISLITAMRIRDQEFLLQSGATDHLQQISADTSDLHQPNVRVLPSIDMQGQDPEPGTSLEISIRPLSISGKSTLLQVQTRPMTKKNPEKEISERRPVHAKPKGPATDKPMLMPTEASNVSPSGLAPSREKYFRPRAP
ncbi:hypothetical protein DY000_02007251 [Brassica cretica]|uniref:Ribosomal protein S4/S9 N-terminal domain-containing protein n=1 Tax=Brassica cretica TaxID=69181 RepID=A0ABQ7CAS2_BRACR|nr:hypothetical protein DY000_02007251 [Brassica cretica]